VAGVPSFPADPLAHVTTPSTSLLRPLPIRVAVLVAALAGGPRASAPQPDAPFRPAPPASSAPAALAFRLGTAARPFAWATAVADFNRDGLADTAVADRLPYVSAGYAYQLRFSVSGLASRSVSFESAYSALTVSVRDVDHDNDLDVVVSEAVSKAVTNVWLNDGHGQFTEAASTAVAPQLEPGQALDRGTPDAEAALEGALTKRAPVVLVLVGFAPALDLLTRPVAQPNRARPSIRSLPLASRAPPVPGAFSA
jgi:hypothetical protein